MALHLLTMPLEVAENRRSRLSSAYRDAQADAGLCTGCERCWEVCWYNAISMLSGAAVKSDACVGCGYCFQVCPTGALEALLGDVLASASFD
ncbi:MAG: 4Fe-4S binding protein [Spirochaetales bacterium]|nr:4Fe-4S binding protein [Spirochaetales bacterium]